MLLAELIEKCGLKLLQGSLQQEIGSLVYDSRKTGPGALFVCIVGARSDGHSYLKQAAEAGTAAVVVEKAPEQLPEEVREALTQYSVTVLQAQDTRLALALLSAAWFGHPMEKMITVGVTGTKGKTTSTHMMVSVLQAAGHKVGLIGTNGVFYGDVYQPTRNTTPESYEIQEYAAQMLAAGCDVLVMEVSSQGLKLHRVGGILYDYGVFTNLSQDHIGEFEHPDFEDYLRSKAMLFRSCRTGIFNRDDPHFEAVSAGCTCRRVTFGKEGADYGLQSVDYIQEGGFLGTHAEIAGKASFGFSVAIPGYFNVYNALSAAALAAEMGISAQAIDAGLRSVRVNGRMESVYSGEKFSILVDYAHNGIATELLLDTLRAYGPKRLVVVFGCGGNRSKDRRYEMGEACGKKADLCIVTADNSRYEKVEDIIRDIHTTLDKTGGRSVDVPDRREAIRYAVEHACSGDMIAVIGKGHEDYQEVNGVRTHFLDREEIIKALREFGYLAEDERK